MGRIKIRWILVFTLSILLGTAEYATAAPPANDNCSSAQAVGNVTNQPFDTSEATFDGPGLFIVSRGNINLYYFWWFRGSGACIALVFGGACWDIRA